MAKARVVHSADACTIIFEGDKRNPEPTTGVIKFPGGNIEVARTTDGSYWVHLSVDDPSNIREHRLNRSYEAEVQARQNGEGQLQLPGIEGVNHFAIRLYPIHVNPTGD